MVQIIVAILSLILAILVNNGFLRRFITDSDSASFGIILLVIALAFTVLGIRKLGKHWTKRKGIAIQIAGTVLVIFVYLMASALVTYFNLGKSTLIENSIATINDNELIKAREEFINAINKSLSKVSEESNGFYSVIASFKNDDITFTYKMNIENDISLNDDPIDALVKETIKTFKENGTIAVLKHLKFQSLNMIYKGTNKENSRKIIID